MSDIQYKDSDGNTVSLNKLCALEPDWAANRIRVMADEIKRLTADNQRLTRLLDDGQSLIVDGCSEPSFTYAMSRLLLGDWVNKVNTELYKQASEDKGN